MPDNDAPLLIYDANERSITHMLALYLWNEFKPLKYDVDCEYNRNINEQFLFDRNRRFTDFIKKISGDKKYEDIGKLDLGDTDGPTVFPDILIHNRCTNDNLIAIEVKKTASKKRNDDFDRKKLEEYLTHHRLKYNYSLFIKIKTLDETKFKDYKDGKSVEIGIECFEFRSIEKGDIEWNVPNELTKKVNKEGCRKVSTFR